jgi:hypothetical protein
MRNVSAPARRVGCDLDSRLLRHVPSLPRTPNVRPKIRRDVWKVALVRQAGARPLCVGAKDRCPVQIRDALAFAAFLP